MIIFQYKNVLIELVEAGKEEQWKHNFLSSHCVLFLTLVALFICLPVSLLQILSTARQETGRSRSVKLAGALDLLSTLSDAGFAVSTRHAGTLLSVRVCYVRCLPRIPYSSSQAYV